MGAGVSYIIGADPHPGRCKNYRPHTHADGYIETRRCLDYENTVHRCEFEPLAHRPSFGGSAGGSWSTNVPKPTPWVKPERAEP